MDYVTIAVGLIPCAFGVYMLIRRLMGKGGGFSSLEAMKDRWGDKAGAVMHIISYVVLPVILGVSLIIYGVRGFSLKDWLTI